MNRKINILCCFLLAIIAPSGALHAQDASMEGLKAMLLKLKSLKVYAYETETNAVFPNGERDKMTAKLVMDAVHKRLLYKTGDQVLLVTDKWAYRADFEQKTVYLFNLAKAGHEKYKAQLPELDRLFKGEASAALIDSLLLKNAHLLSAKRLGDKTTYKLGFQPSYYVKELTVVYDHKKGLPESIYIKSFYPDSKGPDGKVKGTVYETMSKAYSTEVSPSVFDANAYFQIKGGKAVLSQFKNYKVSSVL